MTACRYVVLEIHRSALSLFFMYFFTLRVIRKRKTIASGHIRLEYEKQEKSATFPASPARRNRQQNLYWYLADQKLISSAIQRHQEKGEGGCCNLSAAARRARIGPVHLFLSNCGLKIKNQNQNLL